MRSEFEGLFVARGNCANQNPSVACVKEVVQALFSEPMPEGKAVLDCYMDLSRVEGPSIKDGASQYTLLVVDCNNPFGSIRPLRLGPFVNPLPPLPGKGGELDDHIIPPESNITPKDARIVLA